MTQPRSAAVLVPDLEISISVGFDRATIRLRGELDLASTPMLEHRLTEAFEQQRSLLQIDLSELSLCDSTGLRVLVMTAEQCLRMGLVFQLLGAQAHVRRLFERTHTTDTLNLIS